MWYHGKDYLTAVSNLITSLHQPIQSMQTMLRNLGVKIATHTRQKQTQLSTKPVSGSGLEDTNTNGLQVHQERNTDIKWLIKLLSSVKTDSLLFA